ncbi:hypothetical protein [Chryseobacterium jejuense]|uniref:hypothetical protein n=1 Tax=Chryseobacterium jejuense TaxID=445960 RepID=UPI001AE3C097|nr:hypothetical protein [Chryseobacterium jejuense]MBP2619618.1 hypothetical protein [Chryseobacterium jejuense]
MKKVFLLLPFALCILVKAQVGISTSYPQGTFHVDGAKDNPSDSGPSIIQQSNDFIVTSAGNVGIGTITPATKIDIISSNPGAIKIADGTQGESKVLMSDADGVGTWNTLNSSKATIQGVFPATSQTINSNGSGVRGTGVKISLTKGKWIINAGLTIESQIASQRIWLHAYLSSSQNARTTTGFELLGPAGANSTYAGVIFPRIDVSGDGKFSLLAGSQIINVTSDNVDVWIVIENRPTNTWAYSTGSFENYFYAIPIN